MSGVCLEFSRVSCKYVERRARTARTQHAARRNGSVYHLGGIGALLRTLAISAIGPRLIKQYDWLYDWRPT